MMIMTKQIWVLPEITGGEISKAGLGLLSEAGNIAEKVSGTVTAIVFSNHTPDYSSILCQYGISRVYLFQDPLFTRFSAEAYAAAMLPRLQLDKPWLFLLPGSAIGKELAPRLAVFLETGVVTNCVKIDLSQPEKLKFYRPVYSGQFYQEMVFETGNIMLVTMDENTLHIVPAAKSVRVETTIIEPKLPQDYVKTNHIAFLPADFQTVDVTEAKTVVAAGAGAATDELYPLVQELAELIEGAIGTTRPVVDGGKIPRERLIGQTGKTVSPDLYLALGISGATHHVGGIQESGRIVSINCDTQASIFRNSDIGITADLREILPKLIERIKKARNNGEIL
jgi:electron transfer flavoprotein alpha subunit